MSRTQFFIEARGDAVAFAKEVISRRPAGPLKDGVGLCLQTFEMDSCTHPDLPGGVYIRHEELAPLGIGEPTPADAAGLMPIEDVALIRDLVNVAVGWFSSLGPAWGTRLVASGVTLFSVRADEKDAWDPVGALISLTKSRVPNSDSDNPPCSFLVTLRDGLTVDIFKMPAVVVAWNAVRRSGK
jgi:hypothetical protein